MSILIKDALRVATLDEKNRQIKNGSVYIEGNIIKEIGTNIKKDADEIIDAKGKIVLPGLVNTHHHFYQTLNRNIPLVQNVKLFDWLVNLYEIWRELTPEAVYYSTLVAAGELLLTGCTTTTDHLYLFPEKIRKDLIDIEIKAAQELGIRFSPTRGSMSRGKSKGGLPPDDIVQSEDEIIEDSIRLIEKYHDPSDYSMLKIALAPCSPFSITTELLKETAKLARDKKVRLHTHLAETKDEVEYCKEVYKMRPLAYMESADWIGEDVWYAHCVYLTPEEIDIMAETKTGVAHCPTSNLRLGSGIAPIPEMLEKGVPVGLAVDGSASNDASDMLAEARCALLVHRVKSGVSSTNPFQILRMATSGGANVLGWNKIGVIEPGMAADIIIIDLKQISYAGSLSDPIAAILFSGSNHTVSESIVNGKIVVRNGKLVNKSEAEIIENANRISEEMIEKTRKNTGIDFLKNGIVSCQG